MPALSPQPPPAMPASPLSSGGGAARPPIGKRMSSQSSNGGSRQYITSPSSAGDHHPLRHPMGRQRHAKIVLPRNHSSGRNLAKLGRQAQNAHAHAHVQQAEDGRKHARHHSHEGDTDIRLPGSLDENRPSIRRNMTATDLPSNTSRTKIKKNLSHGQLTRLHSTGRNLAALGSRASPSPGLKGKNKRPRSAEIVPQVREKDLHEQEVELYRLQQEKKEAPKKVGFAVGSVDDTSDGDDVGNMDGSTSLDREDEWTEESASASPLSTRQNTANNSRRTSMVVDKQPPERTSFRPSNPNVNLHTSEARQPREEKASAQEQRPEADGTPAPSEEEEEDEPPSPRSALRTKQQDALPSEAAAPTTKATPGPDPPKAQVRSPLHAAKDHPNPVAQRLVSSQLPAPALVSSVSAMDDMHSNKGSPAPSLRSSRSIVGHDGANDPEQDELVSRFIPSASHPSSMGSGSNTGPMNTPKQGSFHTPEEGSTLDRVKSAPFQVGPVSPGSTISGSSGAATPALGRSRIELKMLHDKALADREAAAERQPLVPHHIYDRRNETLKSYLNLVALGGDGRGGLSTTTGLTLGPEIFQGRFKAVNTELKVVQKFRDPIADAVERLRKWKGSKLSHRSSPQKQQAEALKLSKSAVSLPARASRESSKLSISASPPKSAGAEPTKNVSPQKPAMASAKSAIHIGGTGGGNERRAPRRGVSFAGTPPETREHERTGDEATPDAIARSLWNSVGA